MFKFGEIWHKLRSFKLFQVKHVKTPENAKNLLFISNEAEVITEETWEEVKRLVMDSELPPTSSLQYDGKLKLIQVNEDGSIEMTYEDDENELD